MTNSPTNSLPFYEEAKRYNRTLEVSVDCTINQQCWLKQLVAQLPDDVRLEKFAITGQHDPGRVRVLTLWFSSHKWKDTADQPLRATIEQTIVLT